MAAERTFWEKATLLHMWHHAPPEKKFRDRQSRHYYDVVRLYEHDLGKIAVRDIKLLLEVARHKEVFFPAAWARYTDAKPGTLRLVPPDARVPELEQDYRTMREMIFGEPPKFEHLLDVLREIERLSTDRTACSDTCLARSRAKARVDRAKARVDKARVDRQTKGTGMMHDRVHDAASGGH